MVQILKVKLLNENAQLPTQGSANAAGLDLYSTVEMTIPPMEKGKVPTGIAIKLPIGFYGRIAPRSSLAWKHSIDVLGGVIDRDYRGEIQVILFNLDQKESFKISKGDRIAQMILERNDDNILIEQVNELDTTVRNVGGFGSSDVAKKQKTTD